MLGKIGQYYWINMVSRQKPMKHDTGPVEERSFMIYDFRMKAVNQITHFACPGAELKEYLILNSDHFDQLYLSENTKGQADFWVQRYMPDGQPMGNGQEGRVHAH